MDQPAAGDLVTLATAGPSLDAIVCDVPSATKVVVAVIDRKRGPVLRTVERKALTERSEAGPDDRALQLLLRRTPVASRSAARAGSISGLSRSGHTRGAAHRSTGK